MPSFSRREYLENGAMVGYSVVTGSGPSRQRGDDNSPRDDSKKKPVPVELRVEHETAPIDVGVRHPGFNWALSAVGRGREQTAYRILVASSEETLARDEGDVWDSGRVESSRSVGVEYRGDPLSSSTRYWWKVRIWDESGTPSVWSEATRFETALLAAADWESSWIGRAPSEHPQADDAQAHTPPPAPLVRTEFDVDKPVETARVYASGLGLFELRLNGEPVADRVLEPATTDYNETVRYAVYDVTDALHEGSNAVGAELGNGFYNMATPNWHGWERMDWRGDPKLLLQLEVTYEDGTTDVVTSDESWRLTSGPTVYDDLYEGETYDANLAQKGYATPGFDDTGWTPARVVDPPEGTLAPQTTPPMRVTESFTPEEVWEPRPGVYVFDVGRMVAGWTRLTVEGPPGTKVTLQYGEKLNDDGTVYSSAPAPAVPFGAGFVQTTLERGGGPEMENIEHGAGSGYAGNRFMRDEYVLSGDGKETWEPRFSYKGFRYVQVSSLPEPPTEETITVRRVHSDVGEAGSFACSSDLYGTIHETMKQTVRNNLHGIPTDTPVYEKAGWTGDVHVTDRTMLDNFDMTGFFDKWLDDFPDAQSESGQLPTVVPKSKVLGIDTVSPAWTGAYPSLLLRYYRTYGDRQVLKDHYEPVTAYVEFLLSQRNADGTVDDGLGDWMAPGTNPPEDLGLAGTAFAYKSTVEVATIARVLGNTDDTTRYEKAAESLKTALNDVFFDPEKGHYDTGQEAEYRQTVNVLPLAFDIAPEGHERGVVDSLVADIRDRDGHLNTGVLGTCFLLQVLTEHGHHEVAHMVASRRTFPSWGWWLENGATALYEQWTLESRSRDHYFFGSIDKWFYREVAGIVVDEDSYGYDHTVIEPHPGGGLTWARATRETPRGTVLSGWRLATGRFELDVTIPANGTATVRVPTFGDSSVRLHEGNRLVWNDGTSPGRLPPGIDHVSREGDRIVVEVGSGEYTFDLRSDAIEEPSGGPEGPLRASVSRDDDGPTFTGGQTNRIDLRIDAEHDTVLRDPLPDGWSVVGGDAHEVYEADGQRYIEFTDPLTEGTRTYIVEAPSGRQHTGQHTFGPVEVRAGDEWLPRPGTAATYTVTGLDTGV